MSPSRTHAAVIVAALALAAAPARGQTWNGITTDWNTAINWSPATVPNSPTAVVNFTDAGAGTVNISSSVTVQSLTFNSLSTIYTLTSSANQTLTVKSSINIPAGMTEGARIDLSNLSTGSLQFIGDLTINNNNGNTVTGGLAIGASIGTSGTGGVIFNGSGVTYLQGSFAAPGPTSVIGGLTKNGPGILSYDGSGASLSGGITLNGGNLDLDYNNPASKLGGGALTLDGGILTLSTEIVGTFTQAIPGGTVVNAGHTDVQVDVPTGSIALTLAAGAITHNVGGTIDITPVSSGGTTFAVTTTTGTTNGLLGTGPAYATVSGGSTWATVTGGAITGLSVYGANTYISGTNTDVAATGSVLGITTNSLRFNSGSVTLTLSGTNTLQSGGILVTPSAGVGTITGGTLTATGSGELFVHQYNANIFTINSALVSSTGLTKTGPGTLSLGGTNTGLTGPINVNRGNLLVTTTAAVTSASAINFNDDQSSGFLQQFTVDLGTGVNGMISRPIRVSAFSAIQSDTDYGTYFSTGSSSNSRVQLSGVISSGPGLTTPILFTGGSDNTSGFNLTNAMTFTGNINLLHGFLGITADTSLGNAANVLSLDVNDTTNGGLVFLNTGVILARPVTVLTPTRIVSNGTDSNTISGPISGGAGIYKDGTGTLTITNSGNTITGGVTVAAGTLSLGATGALPSGTNVSVSAGATFSPATATNAAFGTVTLNGGTFRMPAGTGQQYQVNQIVTGPQGGTVDFTGAGSDQLFLVNAGAAITINGNSTWLSPANTSTIVYNAGAVIPITIAPGITLTNGLALATAATLGFRVTGGGTLFQNSDATNVVKVGASVTVDQGSQFRVTDASSNGGVGNLGTGPFTLDGGTFSYGGSTATTTKPIALTANGATIQVESAATTLTANGAITGPGPLTKVGSGTLVLGSSGNIFTNLTVTAGTVQTANDNTLGTGGTIPVAAAGTLQYTGTTATARTFNLDFGTLQAANGATVTLDGAAVNGGFMAGPGTFAVTGGTVLNGVTTFASAPISVTGAGAFTNVSNGSPLTVAAGLANATPLTRFTNQGSGSITVGAVSVVDVSDFQSYGTLTLNPAVVGSGHFTELVNTGSSPLFFNGGSRTFIGTAATAINPATGQPADLAGINLNGQNAVVAGGLLVNNGFVADGSASGTATIIADYGSLVKGAGFFQNSVITQNGGKFQAGNSPGSASFGSFVLGPGGVDSYVFAIDDATGTAGPSPDALGHVSGWSLVKAIQQSVGSGASSGDFTWTADPADKLTLALDTLVNPTVVGTDVAGPMADFDPTQAYSWPAVKWTGNYAGPTDAATLNADTAFDTSGFVNPITGTFGWSLDAADHTLSLTYTPTPVPEPGTLALVGLAAAGLAGWRREPTDELLATWSGRCVFGMCWAHGSRRFSSERIK